MKKIIFFSKNLEIGGMEKALVVLLNNLCDKYTVKLILEEKRGCLLNDLDSKVTIEEYKLFNDKNVFIRKIKNYMKRILWKMRNKNKYDFSCNYATYSVIGSRLAQIASKNCSYYVHSNYYESLEKNLKRIKAFFKPHHLNKFIKIIFVSNECKTGFEKVYINLKNKFVVINNLINSKNVMLLSKEKCNIVINSKKINFIFVGRLDNESKNLDLLIDSFVNVVKINKNYMLYVIGDGPYKYQIKEMIRNNKVQKNIVLLGEMKNPYPYLAKCDCLILTSNYEGFPVVYLEALILNKDIMTTIPTSDEFLDIRDYCTVLSENKDDVVKNILKFKKRNVNYELNFERINDKIINSFKKIIEVK